MIYKNEPKDASLADILVNYIGETVTVYTTGGGASGSGFSGVLLNANRYFIRILTRLGQGPANPIGYHQYNRNNRCYGGRIGSVCDIPIEHIVSFCHNTV
ncbi:MAG: hypothetical protein GX111_00975 [Clostridiales bacterium]|nr:hypothetical protein [Clostridiales bacterium]